MTENHIEKCFFCSVSRLEKHLDKMIDNGTIKKAIRVGINEIPILIPEVKIKQKTNAPIKYLKTEFNSYLFTFKPLERTKGIRRRQKIHIGLIG